MGVTVEIDGAAREVARLDRRAMETLYDSGSLARLGRVELIEGVLVHMSPSKSPHGDVLSAVNAILFNALSGHFRVGVDIGVFVKETTMRAPDICIVPKATPPGYYDAADVVLAVEIGDSTVDDDLDEKAALYGTAGIAEYWVVDLPGRRLHVYRDPRAGGYGDIADMPWTDTVAPLCAPGTGFILADILDGIV